MRLLDKDEPAARHDQARLRAGVARRRSRTPSSSRTAWCWSPAPPARARPTRSTRRSPSSTRPTTNIIDRRGPGRVQPAGINQVQMKEDDRPELRGRPALLPAPGPEHHPGRRDPRLRDGRDRGQGRAHRPPGALHAAHQRRAVDHHPPDEHGHRAVPGGHVGEPDPGPAPRAARSAQDCKRADRDVPVQALIDVGFTPERGRDVQDLSRARAATPATTPATRAASGCTRSWRSPTSIRELDPGRAPRPSSSRRKAIEAGHDHAAHAAGSRRSTRASPPSRKSLRETVPSTARPASARRIEHGRSPCISC